MFKAILALATLLSAVALADPTATVPLDELLRLYRAEQAAKTPEVARPPIRASVGKIEMTGRLLGGAIELTAQIEVTVLTDGEWLTLPLFEKDKNTSLVRMPQLDDGTFSVSGGQLVLVTQKAGTYRFELVFRKTAQGDSKQSVELKFPESAQVSLKVQYDENVFRLLGESEGDGVMLYPNAGRFNLQWERLKAQAFAKQKRPPVESLVTQVNGALVSTLAGRTVTRLVYTLRLEGVRSFDLTLPAGETLERVYVNGSPVTAVARGERLQLDVSPERTGGDTARVEIVLRRQHGGYALSGKLEYALPSTSWNCNELFLTLHLPEAFNYHWSGGSLAPVDAAPEETYAYDLPTPGRVVQLHQQLVERAPTVQVSYSVDLAKSYFR